MWRNSGCGERSGFLASPLFERGMRGGSPTRSEQQCQRPAGPPLSDPPSNRRVGRTPLLGWLVVCAATLAAAQQPTTLTAGGGTLTVQPNGTWSLNVGPQTLLTSAHVTLAAVGWKGSDDQSRMTVTQPLTRDGDDWHVAGTMTDPSTQVVWTFEQRLGLDGDKLHFNYTITPSADTAVAEVSLFCDLPFDSWRGKPVALVPGRTMPFPLELPKDYHFMAGRARGVVLAAGTDQQTTFTLQRPAAVTFQDCRAFQRQGYQLYLRLFAGGQAKANSPYRLEFDLRPQDDREISVDEVQSYRSNQALSIGPLPTPQDVKCFRKVELPLAVAGTWQTPFDPAQIRVDGQLTTPSGRVLTIPAFYTRPYQLDEDAGGWWDEPAGEPGWMLRLACAEPGRYTLEATAQDSSGEVKSQPVSFDAAAAQDPGYIRVSRQDPQYFEFGNGQPYFAVGQNVCTYGRHSPAIYQEWFAKYAKAGCNYARIWMWSHCFGFEYGPPGYYRLDHAADFDRVLELAEQNGIYLKLCLESWRGFGGDRSFTAPGVIHPYAKANGGPCATEMDFFTEPEARRMWRNRLRYVVARWGYSTHLLAWEFWNEINCVWGYEERSQDMIDWTDAMSKYLHELDPYGHLVVNSLGSFKVDDRLWSLPGIDFAQIHGYWHPTHSVSKNTGKDLGLFVHQWVTDIRKYGKPAVFAEYGLVNDGWGPSPLSQEDQEGLELHNGLWSALVSGAAGTAMLWWWDTYTEPLDQYHQYRPVADFVRDVPFTTAGFQPTRPETDQPRLRVLALVGKSEALLWLQNKDHTWWRAIHGGPMPAVPRGQVTLTGLPDGPYQAAWWDTWQGGVTKTERVTVEDGKLVLSTPAIARDVAVKITR